MSVLTKREVESSKDTLRSMFDWQGGELDPRYAIHLAYQRNELLAALKWCENHLRIIEEEDFPNVNPDARMFNSRRNAIAVIRKAEGK